MSPQFFPGFSQLPALAMSRLAGVRAALCVTALCQLLLLGGCVNQPPRPETLAEQEAYMTRGQCAQEASEVYPAFPNPQNPFWNNYYVMCMENMGVPGYAIERDLDGAGWDPEPELIF